MVTPPTGRLIQGIASKREGGYSTANDDSDLITID